MLLSGNGSRGSLGSPPFKPAKSMAYFTAATPPEPETDLLVLITFSFKAKASSYFYATTRSYNSQVISGKILANEITPPFAPANNPFMKKLAEPGTTLNTSLTAKR